VFSNWAKGESWLLSGCPEVALMLLRLLLVVPVFELTPWSALLRIDCR
jgi:hypothetical protein